MYRADIKGCVKQNNNLFRTSFLDYIINLKKNFQSFSIKMLFFRSILKIIGTLVFYLLIERLAFISKEGEQKHVEFILKGIDQYGLFVVFLVVFLEYLNLPGFPAGVILPFSGVWASRGHGFLITFLVTIFAGMLGSILLYYVGKFGGGSILRICMGRSDRVKKVYDSLKQKIELKGSKAVFISKLVPVARTLVGVPAGALNMNLKKYLISSVLGITIWNGVLFSAGYFFGLGTVA